MTNRIKLMTTLAAIALAPQIAPGAANKLPSGQVPFDPRPALSVPAAGIATTNLTLKNQYVSCNYAGWCMIPDMPLLRQTDPKVVKALSDAIATFLKAAYKYPPTTWKNAGTGEEQSLPDAAQSEADVGCSLTSETMLVEALLARLPKMAIATGKAKAYLASPAIAGLSTEQSRLVWQYLEHLIAMSNNQVTGPGLLFVSEASTMFDKWNISPSSLWTGSDGGPDDMAAVGTSFRDFSMQSFANDMEHSGLTKISFHWSKIGIVKTDDGVTHVIRDDVGQHKIALRGYAKAIVDQPATYPILANDPGSGNLVKVRFTTDVAKFNVGKPGTGPIEYDFYDETSKQLINLGTVDPGWMAMIYDGEEPLTKSQGTMSVGLGKDVQFWKVEFVNGISTTFTEQPPADTNPMRRGLLKPYFPKPNVRPGSGPVERRINIGAQPMSITH